MFLSSAATTKVIGLIVCLHSLLASVTSEAFAHNNMRVDRCLLKSYPDGSLGPGNFEFESNDQTSLDLQGDGQILVKLLHISVDPYMRTRFTPGPGYIMPGFEIGKPIASACVAEVIKSENPEYELGSLVTGMMPWETMQVVAEPKSLTKVPKTEGMPSSYFLGVLGLTGLSAYLPFKHFSKDFLSEKERRTGRLCVRISGCCWVCVRPAL